MSPEHSLRPDPIELGLAGVAALVFATGAHYLGVPGGLVVGGTIGAAIVVLVRNREVRLPSASSKIIQTLVGVTVGTRVTPETVSALQSSLAPALLTSLLLIGIGIVTARLLHRYTSAPPWVVLATCPGAMEAVVSIAVERTDGAAEVALFHLVRVVLVILSVPLLMLLV